MSSGNLNRDILFYGGLVVNAAFVVATSVYLSKEKDQKCFGRHGAVENDYQQCYLESKGCDKFNSLPQTDVAASFQTILTLTLVTHCIGLAQSALIWFESMDWLSSILSLNFVVMGVNFIMICTGRFTTEGKFCSGSIQGLESPDLYAKLSERGAYLYGYLIAIVITMIVFLAYFQTPAPAKVQKKSQGDVCPVHGTQPLVP